MCADTIRKDDVSVQLTRHPSGRSRNWYVRIYVPVEVQDLVGQEEVAYAPREKPQPLTPAAIERICASRLADWAMTDDDRVTVGMDDGCAAR